MYSSSISYGGAGNDTIIVFAGEGYGEDGYDILTSYSNGAKLYGGAGTNILKVNFNGYMYGGEGGDEYHLDEMSTSIAYVKDDGLTGNDTIFTTWSSSTTITRTIDGNDLRLSAEGETIVLIDWYNGYNTIENFVNASHDQFILTDL